MKRAVGTVVIRAKGEETERFFNLCTTHGLVIMHIHSEKDYCDFTMYLKDYFRIKEYVKKTKIKTVILKKSGLSFLIRKIRKKAILICFFALFIVCLFSFSQRLWKIRIEGNITVSDDTMMDFLQGHQIHYGRAMQKIECKELETILRESFESFVWTSVSKKGTLLEINVKEGDYVAADRTEAIPCNLVASEDGIVTSMIVRTGVPLVKVNDTITTGQTLVSGELVIKNSDDTIKEIKCVAADADIMIQYHQSITIKLSKSYKDKEYTGKEYQNKILQIGNRLIQNPFQKKMKDTYDKKTYFHQLCILDDIYLPVYFGRVEMKEYNMITKTYTKEEAETILNEKYLQLICSFNEKGVQIIENNVNIRLDDNSYKLEADLFVQGPAVEMQELSTEIPME